VVPTVGFKVEQFVKNNISFTMFDMSGASTHRDLWTAYYAECDAVIYVVDCKDKLRICVAKKELDDMLENPGALAPCCRSAGHGAWRVLQLVALTALLRCRRPEGSANPLPVLREQDGHCGLPLAI
jgi:hypothetical protein